MFPYNLFPSSSSNKHLQICNYKQIKEGLVL